MLSVGILVGLARCCKVLLFTRKERLAFWVMLNHHLRTPSYKWSLIFAPITTKTRQLGMFPRSFDACIKRLGEP